MKPPVKGTLEEVEAARSKRRNKKRQQFMLMSMWNKK